MDDISPEFIERYQILLERNPKSKVFAPLAEAYRKIGLNSRAYTICKTGLEYHPHFAGGHISMAKALIDLDELQKAIYHLEKATELSPENILAHQVIAELFLKMKRHKDALKAFKMVLFLSPDNAKAQKAVKKLESLSAEDFEDEVFENKNETNKPSTHSPEDGSDEAKNRRLERFLSLMDVYIVRNDIEKALKVYGEARQEFATHPDLNKRLKIIKPGAVSEYEEEAPTQPLPPPQRNPEKPAKADILRNYLLKINKHRKDKLQD